MNNGSWPEYHEALTKYGKSIRNVKWVSWKEFCSEINISSDASRVPKIMAIDPNNPIGTLQLPLCGHTKSTGETFDLLLGTHFPRFIYRDDFRS